MPPPSDHFAFQLTVFENPFYVKQFKLGETIPPHLLNSLVSPETNAEFISITRTDEEISVVGESTRADTERESTWRCIRIVGPMGFDVTGVMCDFTTPLKQAEIPIFALSTWSTDYILVPREHITKAVSVLENDGWKFVASYRHDVNM